MTARSEATETLASGTHDRLTVVGMVHLAPLPGSPGWDGSMDAVLERACSDAAALCQGGVDGLIVENYGDKPFFADAVPPETVAAMTAATSAVARVATVPVGVNVLRNDALAALSVAVASQSRFIRVNVLTGTMATDQGWIRGRAAELARLQRSMGSAVEVFADVFVKHASPPPGLSIEVAARDTWERGGAHALIVSGSGTGAETSVTDLARVRDAVPEAPVWVGSGARTETLAELAGVCTGVIVGSAVQQNGEAGQIVDPARLERFINSAHKARS